MRPVTRVLAACIGLLLVVGVVGAVTVDDDASAPARTVATSAASTTTAAPTNTTSAPDIGALVHELQGFVEDHRGLKFSQPIKVALLADAAFSARVVELSKQDDAELLRTGAELRALGLLKPGVDLIKARNELLGAAIVGFYDPKTTELVVRGSKVTPLVRTTLAHEITHALQDQTFHIEHPEFKDRDDEVDIAFSAIAGGDALRVEEAYRNTMTRSEQRQEAAEERVAAQRINSKDIPPILSQLLVFPYADGPPLVSALLRSGQGRLDDAFRRPPTTTEQVMHPERFIAGEGPKPVPDPTADAAQIDKGVMGELVLKLLLGTVLPNDQAGRDAAGWGGDRYVAWSDGDRTCVRVAFVMDTPNDEQELRTGLTIWATKQKAATVSRSGPTTLTTCA